jgi:hypothetical protein
MAQNLLKVFLASGLVSLLGTAATGQTKPPTCTPVERPVRFMWAASLAGCPFSAVLTTETTQTLADGTTIRKQFKAPIYRDSAGRIRYESYAPMYPEAEASETPSMIQILDPVGGVTYYLMPQHATATRQYLGDPGRNNGGNQQAQRAPAQSSTSKPMQDMSSQIVDEKLDPQEIEGLLATGVRQTRTIPAGAEGNDRPIVITTETWRSSVMQITLVQKRADPRTGDSEMRMTDLKQEEPDALLFQVPAEYKISGE